MFRVHPFEDIAWMFFLELYLEKIYFIYFIHFLYIQYIHIRKE